MILKINNKATNAEGVAQRQEIFLNVFRECGSITKACNAIGLNADTVTNWKKRDSNGFLTRFDNAGFEFAESLQDMALDRVKKQKPSDNPTLLIAMLNANHPKYRPLTGNTDEVTRDVMTEMRKTLKHMNDEAEVIEVEVDDKEEFEKLLESKKK
jgi:hypothetical protein